MPIKYRKFIFSRLKAHYDPETNSLDNPSEELKQMAKQPPADYVHRTNTQKAPKK